MSDSSPLPRADGRAPDQLRPVRFIPHFAPHATGSVLVEFGRTRVICAATVEESVPRWMKDQKVSGGWLTAEYSMLPYSTLERKARDISKLKLDGRSQEIQRLIGRALRAVIDLEKLGPRTVWVDCDVLQADGGTRTASITGAYVALELAFRKLISTGLISATPFQQAVAAVSCGVLENGRVVLDLDYLEDSAAAVDLNLVAGSDGRLIEIQASGEESTFSQEQLLEMLALARHGTRQLFDAQLQALNLP